MRVLICYWLTFSCFGATLFGATLSVASGPRVQAFEARNGPYVSHGPGYALWVTSGGAVLNLGGHTVRMFTGGGNPKASLEGLDPMPGRANYLVGRDVRASYNLYGRVRVRGVYRGIDLLFHGNQERLEYDFEIAAGGDPGKIELSFDGAECIRIGSHGDLVLQDGALEIHQPKPVVYQEVAGKRRLVAASYRIDNDNHVHFRIGEFDRRRPLVIDPQIVFDKTFGGSGVSTAAGLARDTQGNLYVAGTTNAPDFAAVGSLQSHLATSPLLVTGNAGQSWNFPSLGSARTISALAAAPSSPTVLYAATPVGVFVSADGGATWTAAANTGLAGPATLLAVDAGAATTLYAGSAQGVFVSTDGAATWRKSTNGPVGTGVVALAAHPTQAGTVFASVQSPPAVYRSTDSGQSWTQLPAIAAGQFGNPVSALVIGSNGAIVAATSQGLLLSADNGDTWSAGAKPGVFQSQELAIAPNNPSIVYLIGEKGLQRSSDGGQTFSLVLPSVTSNYLGAVAVDPRNPANVYAAATVFPANTNNVLYRSTDAGQTWTPVSLPYPVLPLYLLISPVDSRVLLGTATQNDVFVTKWSADGSQVLYSTYLGGSQREAAGGIAVDGSGSAYVTGITSSPDFPTTSGAYQTKLTTPQDAFVAKLSPDGSRLIYATLLGGDLTERQCCTPTSATGIAVDNTGECRDHGLHAGHLPGHT